MRNRAHNFTVNSDLHDLYVFLEATQFAVVVYKNHWEQAYRLEFTDAKQALDEAKKHERSLLYAITEVSRTAAFGHASFKKLERVLLEEYVRKQDWKE